MAVRKIGHFCAFMVLAGCGHLAVLEDAKSWRVMAVASSSMNLPIAVIAELLQAYAVGRYPTARDAGINLAGTLVGIAIAQIYEFLRLRYRRTKLNPA